ncbi:MAG: glycine cleavage T C-terminal barrel domain-containing protein [Pseudomonadota bacterium]
MAQPNTNRLDRAWGNAIDRDQVITFEFEGKSISGYQGDTIASALIANCNWLLSRSFKYHRARGPLTMAGQDANTLVQLVSAPNTLADKHLIEQDLAVFGQNYLGSLANDRMSILGWFGRFLPVGFYYKAFFRPRGIWEWWVKLIRKSAGLGKIDTTHTPPYRDKQYLFCDVAIVGAGPAGLSSALAAADAGAEVILIDENSQLGGSGNYTRLTSQEDDRLEELKREVVAHEGVRVLLDATCNSWHADHWLAVVTDTRLFKLRAKKTILATGVFEQPATFRGNDIPGVIFSSAVQRLLRMYAVKPADRAVVLAGNDEAYAVAFDLADAGVQVVAIADLRAQPANESLIVEAKHRGIDIELKTTVYEATPKNNRLAKVELRPIVAEGECADHGKQIDCELLCTSVGYMPQYQLACQAGGQLSYDDDLARFTITQLPEGMSLAGSIDNQWTLSKVIEHGQHIGLAAARGEQPQVSEIDPIVQGLNFSWPIFPHPKGKEFVDFDEDLQIADILNATKDGYENIQLVKRYSTAGMGPSQGRHSALTTARLVASATGKTVAETGVTTARPPFASEPLGVNAGRSFYPARKTAMHQKHIDSGAVMMQAGAWYRPAYYGSSMELTDEELADELIASEVKHVRTKVGLVDVSTLGGLEVRGPDAAAFLNRFYTSTFDKVEVGKSKYALLTNEAGVVIDDGVACRLSQDHFYVTATTGGVDRVFQAMLKWNIQWQLDVDIANATSAWCAINLAGPHSRKVIEKLTDVNVSQSALPYMGVRSGLIAGMPARILRVGFVGELGYEIHVPQLYGQVLWDSILEAGREFDIRPFGIEAQRMLRMEKGHIIIGQDTDAMSTPFEVQMRWAVGKSKPYFVGNRSLKELDERGQKRSLIGFTFDAQQGTPKESHLVLQGQQMVGRVTSAAISPTLKIGIGLAYVPMELAEVDQELTIKVDGGKRISAKVVRLPFYDAELSRQEVE